MNIFDKLTRYAESWKVKDSRSFTKEEISAVNDSYVVNSNYGLSVCFCMIGGGKTFIPLSRDSELTSGDKVDMTKAKLLTLWRSGDADINRVSI